jgi:hypothetical protein
LIKRMNKIALGILYSGGSLGDAWLKLWLALGRAAT